MFCDLHTLSFIFFPAVSCGLVQSLSIPSKRGKPCLSIFVRKCHLSTQLEVQWVYSGHLVYLQWGTVHALHAVYSGHCTLYVTTVCRFAALGLWPTYCRWHAAHVQCPTVGTLNAHCTPTALRAGKGENCQDLILKVMTSLIT